MFPGDELLVESVFMREESMGCDGADMVGGSVEFDFLEMLGLELVRGMWSMLYISLLDFWSIDGVSYIVQIGW